MLYFRRVGAPLPLVGGNGFCRLGAAPPSDDPGMSYSCHLSRKQVAQTRRYLIAAEQGRFLCVTLSGRLR